MLAVFGPEAYLRRVDGDFEIQLAVLELRDYAVCADAGPPTTSRIPAVSAYCSSFASLPSRTSQICTAWAAIVRPVALNVPRYRTCTTTISPASCSLSTSIQ